jgi:hypothetical protein
MGQLTEKEMEETFDLGKATEQTRELTALLSLMKRQRKKSKPIETVLEALNKLGSRRPTKQRFSVHFDRDRSKFIVYTAHEETVLPLVLHHTAEEIYCKPTKEKLK